MFLCIILSLCPKFCCHLFQCQDHSGAATHPPKARSSSTFVRIYAFCSLYLFCTLWFCSTHQISAHTYSAFNAHALGALAEVAGPGLDSHLSAILPALLNAMGYTDTVCLLTDMCICLCGFHIHFLIFLWNKIQEVQSLAKKAAETVVSVVDEEGMDSLLSELLKGVGDSQA